MDIEIINKAFDEYVSHYDMKDEKIRLKYTHTFRVAEQCLEISKSIGLDEEGRKLAYLIGILHDIGRFEQEKVYHTYNDFKSIDHADLACEILFNDGVIRNFIKDDKYDDIICEAVMYHNKYNVCSWEEDEVKLLYSEIIRDADKIDIINNVVNRGEIKLPEDDNGVGKEVDEDFRLEMPVHHSHKETKNDSTLTMVAFVFDLNFPYSYEYFKEHDFINKMYDKLKNKELFWPYINQANEYVKRKCKNVRNKIFS